MWARACRLALHHDDWVVAPDSVRDLSVETNESLHGVVEAQRPWTVTNVRWRPAPVYTADSADREWLVRECGGQGDCLYHCLGWLTNQPMTAVRAKVASAVHTGNVALVWSFYAPVYPGRLASEMPALARAVPQLRSLIRTCGYTFQGDELAVQLWTLATGIGVLVWNADCQPPRAQAYVHRQCRSVVALYFRGRHWRVLGQRCPQQPLVEVAWPVGRAFPSRFQHALAQEDAPTAFHDVWPQLQLLPGVTGI